MDIEQVYKERFPLHAYATDDVSRGIRMYSQDLALKKAIVQHNYKHSKAWLVYDIDRSDSGELLNAEVPQPNIAIFNPENGHGHFLYGLEKPVHNYNGASQKALRYFGSIDVALTELLGADPGYSKLLSKNPTHDRWITVYRRYELYDLDELADYLDLEKYRDKRKRLPAIGYGRNTTLFERLRQWAYRERRKEQAYLSEEMFLEAVRYHALVLNAEFQPPLPHAEVRATAKSVARWTWANMSPEGFIERQRRLGQKGTVIAAAMRTAKARELRQAIAETAKQCPSITQADIAAMFNVRRETVNRHLREVYRAYRGPLSDKG